MTTADAPFVRTQVTADAPSGKSDVEVLVSALGQEISGFGGAFNERGWEALAVLSAAERNEVLASLFDPAAGLRFNRARVPIGASDYALDRYTLDESPDDYSMQHFTLQRDKQRLIPYILAAKKFRPDLEVWGSAWTPPTWMKTNHDFDGGAMKDDPRVYSAYALYLAEFVQRYAAVGIPVFMVVPQNEPGQLTHYPSCDWQPAQYAKFIGRHLGPLLRQRQVPAHIYAGTINRPDWDVVAALSDKQAATYITGVAVQWGGLLQLPRIRKQFPSLDIMQSETECGNNHWESGFNPEVPPNDFRYAAHTWRKFRDFFKAGSSSYFLWNMVLDEHGKNIDSLRRWPQNSAIVVDSRTKTVTYTPMFQVTKHFSGLVDVKAHLVQSTGAYPDQIAFLNPDGTVVVELLNGGTAPARVVVTLSGASYLVELPAASVASLVVAPQSSLAKPRSP